MKGFACLVVGSVLAGCSPAPEGAEDPLGSSPPAIGTHAAQDAPVGWYEYVNARFDFVVEVPPGFAAEPASAYGDGRAFTRGAARLRVSGTDNLDEPFASQIAAARQGLSVESEERTSPGTWRARGSGAGGPELLTLARGEERLVTVRFAYPADDGELAEQGQRVLDSLRFVGHAGPVAYRFRPDLFVLAEVPLALPGAEGLAVEAQKLIAWRTAAGLGKRACRYGPSPRLQVCDAEREPGLAFAVLDRPIHVVHEAFSAAAVEPSALAGREGFRTADKGPRAGMSFAFIPAGTNTVAVARNLPGDAGRGGDHPDFETVLRSLATAEGARPGAMSSNAGARAGLPEG